MGFLQKPCAVYHPMAIYSLHHKSIGRTTHKAGRAGAHIRYISRRSAEPIVVAHLMPADWKAAKRWLDREERSGRKNERVADLIMVALPIELNHDQREQLVKSYIARLTRGKVPSYAAIHQTGEDEHNPHAHILIRDKSPSDGRRVLLMSERGSTKRIRKEWAEEASMALKMAGFNIKLDHRSYADRNLNIVPGRHRGPGWRKKRSTQKVLNYLPDFAPL